MLNFFFTLCMILFITLSILLIMIVLIQKGRGGGIASAFGGAGGSSAFGAKTGDVLTWVTSVVFGLFLVLAIGLNLMAQKLQDIADGNNPVAQTSTTPQPQPQPQQAPPLNMPAVNPDQPKQVNQPEQPKQVEQPKQPEQTPPSEPTIPAQPTSRPE